MKSILQNYYQTEIGINLGTKYALINARHLYRDCALDVGGPLNFNPGG